MNMDSSLLNCNEYGRWFAEFLEMNMDARLLK